MAGSTIDLKRDLGLADHAVGEFRLTLHPSLKHKLRLEVTPLRYEQQGALTTDIVFQGETYRVGVPVNSLLDWKAWRIGYEYDFVSGPRGFGGFILDIKYTDLFAELNNPSLRVPKNTQQTLPIPTLGGIARIYIIPQLAITGEITGIAIPDSPSLQFDGHFVEGLLGLTINANRFLAIEASYRALDVAYAVHGTDVSTGSLKLHGPFIGLTARF